MPTPPASITTIDCHYHGEPEKAAAFLVVEGDRAAFVDNNTNIAVPRLLAALEARGISPEHVDYLIVTHVHLDHAGGTAELLRHCPNATVLAHPKAARHLVDPSRLVAGAKIVYGEEAFTALYGEIEPVPEDRIHIMEDGETLRWGSRTFTFLYTKGHASHHFCIHDSGENALFAGDAFGLGRMPSMRPGPAFLVCTSSPPEFDPPEARISVQRVLDTGAKWAYITHFGVFDDLQTRAAQLLASIGHMEEVAKTGAATELSGPELEAFCSEKIGAAFREHLKACGVADPEADLEWLKRDIGLNAMGAGIYAERLRKAPQQPTAKAPSS